MAYVTKGMRQKFARDARYEREMLALKTKREMVQVPFEWPTAQTAKAVKFPSYGWVPAVALRWKQKDTGLDLPWSGGRDGDTFFMAKEFAEGK